MGRRIGKMIALLGILNLLVLSTTAVHLGSIRIVTKGGTVALYRVGDFEDSHFRLLESYGGEAVTFEEFLSQELAVKLVQKARCGYVKAADIHGLVEFTDQKEGLYLVVQRSAPEGYEPFSPFLVSIPWDGDEWQVTAEPKLEGTQPQTGDRAHPDRWIAVMCICGAGLVWCILRGWEEIRKV